MKKLVALIAALVLCCAAPMSLAAENPFTDVSRDAYYYDAVLWAYEKEVTRGTTETTFSPDAPCTRGQVVTFLWRAKGRPEPAAATHPFTDVAPGSYCEKAVMWAVEKGITNGTSSTTFSPGDTCTSAQIITFLWRANGSPESGAPSALTANWPDRYYNGAVSWADFGGLLKQTGIFRPMEPCTRANTVTWLHLAAADAEEISVSNVEELAAAIGSNRTIQLAPGVYNLTAWLDKAADGAPENEALVIEEVYDGRELQIHGVRNLTLTTLDYENTSLVVEPRYADVLGFYGCEDITLNGLTLGHTKEPGSCAGEVLSFTDCEDVLLGNLDLYGCGTYGIAADSVRGLEVYETAIHDCSYGIMTLNGGTEASFTSLTCQDNREYTMIELMESQASFSGCVFRNNTYGEGSSFLYIDETSRADFTGCVFDQKDYASLAGTSGFGRNLQVGEYFLNET